MDASTVAVTLTPVPAADLPALAEGLAPSSLDGRFVEGAPIPRHVAVRVLGQLVAGKPMLCVGRFYIVDGDGRCVGGCGFRDVPHRREVEIGYHLAPASRGRGYAAAALRRLLDIAAASGEVDTVLAQIRPDNAASSRLAQRRLRGGRDGVRRRRTRGAVAVAPDIQHGRAGRDRRLKGKSRDSLQRLQRQLDPDRFQRVHRSSMVRLEAVAEMRALSNRDAILRLHNGSVVRASRTYADLLRARLRS